MPFLYWGTQSSRCDLTTAEQRGDNHIPQSAACAPVRTAWVAAGLRQLTLSSLPTRAHKVFSAELLLGVSPPRYRTLHLSLLNFTRLLSAHSSSLPQPSWTALPSSVSTDNTQITEDLSRRGMNYCCWHLFICFGPAHSEMRSGQKGHGRQHENTVTESNKGTGWDLKTL